MSLFDADSGCPFYHRVRNDPEFTSQRKFAESLWRRFGTPQDDHFLQEFPKRFQQRFWEMYLFVALQEAGFDVQKNGPSGPDFWLELEGRKYWIEAHAPESGKGPDAVPIQDDGGVHDFPTDQILLRYTSALQTKTIGTETKPSGWREWIANGQVGTADGYIVAINGSLIPSAPWEGPVPHFVSAYLACGPLTLALDSQSGRVVDRHVQYKGSIHKRSGSPVQTDAMLIDPRYRSVSAVLHSFANGWNGARMSLGEDFRILFNPSATVVLPDYAVRRWWRFKVADLVESGEFKLSTFEPGMRSE